MSSTYFPRGKGPLVSILIPTRGRPRGLTDTVGSLYNLAKEKSNLEFIFKVDDDDKETTNLVHKIADKLPICKVVSSPRGRGYLDLHKWINQMCSIASGDWLFLMNDDAVMVTQDWDYYLNIANVEGSWPGINEICLLIFSEENQPFSMGWFVLRRQTYELLGYFSPSPLCDDWLNRVMSCCGCKVRTTEICVCHHGVDDILKKENLAVNDEAIRAITSFEQIKTRTDSVNRITNRMSRFESRRKWSQFPPQQEGWMLWKEFPEKCTRDVYFLDVNNIRVQEKNGTVIVKRFEEMNGLWCVKE